MAGGRGAQGAHFPLLLHPSHPARWAEKPSGRGGQGAAFTPNSRTRRPLKGYYSPSRWEIVPANDCVAPDIFQGTFQKPADLIFMAALRKGYYCCQSFSGEKTRCPERSIGVPEATQLDLSHPQPFPPQGCPSSPSWGTASHPEGVPASGI